MSNIKSNALNLNVEAIALEFANKTIGGLGLNLEAIVEEATAAATSGIDFDSVMLTGNVATNTTNYRNITWTPGKHTITDQLLNAAHAMLVDAGIVLKQPFAGEAMAGVHGNVYQVQRDLACGDRVIISAPILNGELNTTKLTVGNYNHGEINIYKEVARRPIKNGIRLTTMYAKLQAGFAEYIRTLKQLDQVTFLEKELKDLEEEVAQYESCKPTRVRLLATRELKAQVKIVEGLLAKHK